MSPFEQSRLVDFSGAALAAIRNDTILPKARKIYRVHAFKYLLALDNTMQTLCGYSFNAFMHTRHDIDEAVQASKKLPILSIAMDQGSSGFSATFFCQSVLGLMLAPLWDPSHRCVRDIELAFNHTGLSECVLLLKVALNTNFGPWDGSAFWRKQQEEVVNYTNGQCHVCPLFQRHWADIAAAGGLTLADTMDAHVQAEYFRSMPSSAAFTSKGPRLQPSRWHSFLDVYAYWKPFLPVRKLVLLYHAIMEGWVLRVPGAYKVKAPTIHPHEDPKKATTKLTDQQNAAKLYSLCNNTLHVSLVLLQDPDLMRKCDIMLHLCSPLRQWHGDQACFLRSAQLSVQYCVAQSLGQPLGSIGAVLQGLKWENLCNMGFTLALSPATLAVGEDSPEVFVEDEWMALAARLSLVLAKHRFSGSH